MDEDQSIAMSGNGQKSCIRRFSLVGTKIAIWQAGKGCGRLRDDPVRLGWDHEPLVSVRT